MVRRVAAHDSGCGDAACMVAMPQPQPRGDESDRVDQIGSRSAKVQCSRRSRSRVEFIACGMFKISFCFPSSLSLRLRANACRLRLLLVERKFVQSDLGGLLACTDL